MVQKPSFLKVGLYLFTKYLVFFIVLAFLDKRYKTIVLGNAKNADDIVLGSFEYLLEVLFATFLLILVLSIPVYLLFKLNNITCTLLAFFALITVEYFIYEAAASYIHFDIDGVINGFISVIFFPIFFGKFIASLRFAKKNKQYNHS